MGLGASGSVSAADVFASGGGGPGSSGHVSMQEAAGLGGAHNGGHAAGGVGSHSPLGSASLASASPPASRDERLEDGSSGAPASGQQQPLALRIASGGAGQASLAPMWGSPPSEENWCKVSSGHVAALGASGRVQCERLAQTALLRGDFRGAVVAILAAGGASRAAEALWIAAHASTRDAQLLADTVGLIAAAGSDEASDKPLGFLGAAAALVHGNVASLIEAPTEQVLRADPTLWKDTLAAVLTFGGEDEKGGLLQMLASRCAEAGLPHAATIVGMVGGDLVLNEAADDDMQVSAVRWLLSRFITPDASQVDGDTFDRGLAAVCDLAVWMRESGAAADVQNLLHLAVSLVQGGEAAGTPCDVRAAAILRQSLALVQPLGAHAAPSQSIVPARES